MQPFTWQNARSMLGIYKRLLHHLTLGRESQGKGHLHYRGAIADSIVANWTSLVLDLWRPVVNANITPDPYGIPYHDSELFTQALHTGYVKARPLNQIMSWGVYGGLTDEDIAAVFANIKTLKPGVHHVDNTEPPTYCKLE